jgi:hypothetical protein
VNEANDTLTRENQTLRGGARRVPNAGGARQRASYAVGSAGSGLNRLDGTGSQELLQTDGSTGSRDGSLAGDNSSSGMCYYYSLLVLQLSPRMRMATRRITVDRVAL